MLGPRASLLARASCAAARRALASAPEGGVGFIGLGNMGGYMAANLLRKSGLPVTVFDINPTATAKLRALGATVAASPKEVAERSPALVVTMLPSSPHARAAYLGENGVLAGAQSSALLVDASTIDPQAARDISRAAADLGLTMVDAPVSGGTPGAEAGTLTFMVGANDAATFGRASGYLAHMGKNVVLCGGVGSGQVVKLCNNLVLGITMIGLSEAMNLGRAFGTDPKVMQQIFATSSASCWSNNVYNPCPGAMEGTPAERDYSGGFGVELMKKDLGLVLDAANQVGAPLQMGAMAHQIYQLLSAHGLGQKDFSAVFQHLQRDQSLVPGDKK